MLKFPFDPPPANLGPMENELHIFHASLDLNPVRLGQLEDTLSGDERERAARLRFEKDRDRFVAGRGLLREILGRLLRLSPAALIFSVGPRGKPRLDAAMAGRFLNFNLAHSDGYAVYAVSPDAEVGIDLERIRSVPEAAGIVAQFFPERQAASWRALAPAQRLDFFFECWTRMEAYLKAIGEGLTESLEETEELFASDQQRELPGANGALAMPPGWFVHPLQSAPGYAGAVATKLPGPRLVNWAWDVQPAEAAPVP